MVDNNDGTNRADYRTHHETEDDQRFHENNAQRSHHEDERDEEHDSERKERVISMKYRLAPTLAGTVIAAFVTFGMVDSLKAADTKANRLDKGVVFKVDDFGFDQVTRDKQLANARRNADDYIQFIGVERAVDVDLEQKADSDFQFLNLERNNQVTTIYRDADLDLEQRADRDVQFLDFKQIVERDNQVDRNVESALKLNGYIDSQIVDGDLRVESENQFNDLNRSQSRVGQTFNYDADVTSTVTPTVFFN